MGGVFCCLDGNLTNSGSTGGSPAAGTFSTSLRRSNTKWNCTNDTKCPDKWQNLSGNSVNRGMDIFFAPTDASCYSPRLLYVHGGSWNGGSPNETGYFQAASRLAAETGAVVMSIDYPIPGTCLGKDNFAGTCDVRSNFTVLVSWAVK